MSLVPDEHRIYPGGKRRLGRGRATLPETRRRYDPDLFRIREEAAGFVAEGVRRYTE